jgi:hypothetical protein
MALMPPKDIHNPKRWRDRAAEIRALAESATDARHNVIHLADGWGLALAQCIWASAGEAPSGPLIGRDAIGCWPACRYRNWSS